MVCFFNCQQIIEICNSKIHPKAWNMNNTHLLAIINIIIEVGNPGNISSWIHCQDSTAGHILNDEKV